MSSLKNTPRSACLSAILLAGSVHAQTEADFQDAARPFGLSVSGPVMEAGSDAASADFQANDLPVLLDFVNKNLSESQSLKDIAAVSLDPEALKLRNDSEVRIYFLSEGAGYRNTLGYTVDGADGKVNSDPSLIFPDASSMNQYYEDGGDVPSYARNNSTPLVPGDFVDLGVYEASSLLDFFLISNGANGWTDVYTADEETNPDLMQHVVAFALEGSPYLLIGFEDLYGGGDMDYNDLVFAVDIGATNVSYLANPEPAFCLMMSAVLGAGFWFYRRSPSFRAAF